MNSIKDFLQQFIDLMSLVGIAVFVVGLNCLFFAGIVAGVLELRREMRERK